MPELNIQGYPNNLRAFQVTIPSGASVSEMFTTQGASIVGILMPAGWDAASIGYAACFTGNPSNLVQIFDSGGNAEKTTVAAAHFIAMPQADAVYAPWLQLLSVAAADGTTPVTQNADRVITLVLRRFLS